MSDLAVVILGACALLDDVEQIRPGHGEMRAQVIVDRDAHLLHLCLEEQISL